ncbi:hypothetical protein [Pseudomonas chlororaphis]|uniref:hypothetical protein n=1 Tax=Pseudomonas chlororaphis TaxID=587753 RepID=UPI0015DE59B9|nr:hypothetical protein [Pseudomonas chlororaphis]QLL13482.1 hypothetical protein H0I86_31765 [Pseudomonas chlororaphis subsp. aurantiaca]
MKKIASIFLMAFLVLMPWYMAVFSERNIVANLSCVANYEILKIGSDSEQVRAFGSLYNGFSSNGKVLIHYVGDIERRDSNGDEHYNVNREAHLQYYLINNLIFTKTIGSQRLLLDNAPDVMVQRFIHPGFQQEANGRAFIYRLSERYWATGFSDSPRILCKISEGRS